MMAGITRVVVFLALAVIASQANKTIPASPPVAAKPSNFLGGLFGKGLAILNTTYNTGTGAVGTISKIAVATGSSAVDNINKIANSAVNSAINVSKITVGEISNVVTNGATTVGDTVSKIINQAIDVGSIPADVSTIVIGAEKIAKNTVDGTLAIGTSISENCGNVLTAILNGTVGVGKTLTDEINKAIFGTKNESKIINNNLGPIVINITDHNTNKNNIEVESILVPSIVDNGAITKEILKTEEEKAKIIKQEVNLVTIGINEESKLVPDGNKSTITENEPINREVISIDEERDENAVIENKSSVNSDEDVTEESNQNNVASTSPQIENDNEINNINELNSSKNDDTEVEVDQGITNTMENNNPSSNSIDENIEDNKVIDTPSSAQIENEPNVEENNAIESNISQNKDEEVEVNKEIENAMENESKPSNSIVEKTEDNQISSTETIQQEQAIDLESEIAPERINKESEVIEPLNSAPGDENKGSPVSPNNVSSGIAEPIDANANKIILKDVALPPYESNDANGSEPVSILRTLWNYSPIGMIVNFIIWMIRRMF